MSISITLPVLGSQWPPSHASSSGSSSPVVPAFRRGGNVATSGKRLADSAGRKVRGRSGRCTGVGGRREEAIACNLSFYATSFSMVFPIFVYTIFFAGRYLTTDTSHLSCNRI